ncbi:hypothetical protein DFH07DRAFT_954536 [Mycena maculata]|uniref:Secreted protein n=1 Tax=Mycena maculata TaxID=230809 RepID=A0AAD7NN60_9AGAR|nr:hypothetical protein DFH07DRAFT_954536 [Mycena maculata]
MQQEGRALAPQTGELLCLVPLLLLTICRRVNVRHGRDILDKSIGLVLVGDTASCGAAVPPGHAISRLQVRSHPSRPSPFSDLMPQGSLFPRLAAQNARNKAGHHTRSRAASSPHTTSPAAHDRPTSASADAELTQVQPDPPRVRSEPHT